MEKKGHGQKKSKLIFRGNTNFNKSMNVYLQAGKGRQWANSDTHNNILNLYASNVPFFPS